MNNFGFWRVNKNNGNVPFPTNLLMHYDGFKASNIIMSAPPKVDQWNDIGGHNLQMKQVTTANKPVYNAGKLRFDSNQYLINAVMPDTSRNNITQSTWFAVFGSETTTGVVYYMQYATGSPNTNYLPVIYFAGQEVRARFFNTNGNTLYGKASFPTDGVTRVVSVVWDSNNLKIYVNGVLGFESSTGVNMVLGNIERETIGCSLPSGNPNYYFKGTIQNVMQYNIAMTDAQRIEVEDYLSNTYL